MRISSNDQIILGNMFFKHIKLKHLFKKPSLFYQIYIDNNQNRFPKMYFDKRIQILNRREFQVFERIGRGGFGEVYRAFSAVDNEVVAIKVIQRKEKFPVKYLYQEMNSMRITNHPNTTRFIEQFSQNQYFFIVMEYCNYGDLHGYLESQPEKMFQTQKAVSIIVQILKGLFALHSNYILHRDLKLQNILLHLKAGQMEPTIKISDFGLSTQTGCVEAVSTCGSDLYIAPEILEGDRYGFQVDLWAVGVILFRLVFKKFPFCGSNKKKMMEEMILKCERSDFTDAFSLTEIQGKDPRLINFLQRLFVVKNYKRIKLYELTSHPLFEQHQKQLSQMTNFYSKYYYKKQNVTIEGRQFLLDYDPQIVNAKLDIFNKILTHQIKKFQYLKQIGIKSRNNFKKHLSREQQSKISFHILKACIFFCTQLLNYLKAFILPPSLKNKISPSDWSFCVKTPAHGKYCRFLEQQINSSYQDYDQVCLNLQICNRDGGTFEFQYQIKQEKFEQFKHRYREGILKALNILIKRKSKDLEQLAQLKLELFCCYMINRVFNQNPKQTFPFFLDWGIRKKVQLPNQFCFERFKQWVKQEQTWKIELTLDLLKIKYF